MQYYYAFVVFSISCFFANTQADSPSTVHVIVQPVTTVKAPAVPETTAAPVPIVVQTAAPITTAAQTAASMTMVFQTTAGHGTATRTTVPSLLSTVTTLSNKAFGSGYVEPPPHPLGYCIRSRLRCSKIRRCCTGPCNVNKMKCP